MYDRFSNPAQISAFSLKDWFPSRIDDCIYTSVTIYTCILYIYMYVCVFILLYIYTSVSISISPLLMLKPQKYPHRMAAPTSESPVPADHSNIAAGYLRDSTRGNLSHISPLLSGKLTFCYGKSPFLMGKSPFLWENHIFLWENHHCSWENHHF